MSVCGIPAAQMVPRQIETASVQPRSDAALDPAAQTVPKQVETAPAEPSSAAALNLAARMVQRQVETAPAEPSSDTALDPAALIVPKRVETAPAQSSDSAPNPAALIMPTHSRALPAQSDALKSVQPSFRKDRRNPSKEEIDRWLADGKPKCSTCGKPHPGVCDRTAEEVAAIKAAKKQRVAAEKGAAKAAATCGSTPPQKRKLRVDDEDEEAHAPTDAPRARKQRKQSCTCGNRHSGACMAPVCDACGNTHWPQHMCTASAVVERLQALKRNGILQRYSLDEILRPLPSPEDRVRVLRRAGVFDEYSLDENLGPLPP